MSGEGYGSPIVGALGILIRQAIRSKNFLAGVAGWAINADGSAEFSNLSIRGSIANLLVGTNAAITGDLDVAGTSTVQDLDVGGTLTAANLALAGNLNVPGSLAAGSLAVAGILSADNIRRGSAITPAPGGSAPFISSVTVTFANAMSGTPSVVCSPTSAVGAIDAWTATGISNTGFTLTCNRTNNQTTGFNYIAISNM